MTVLGPIDADQLGPTLTHEHLLIDARCYWREPEDPALRELALSPVEITNLHVIRRNPYLIRDNAVLDDPDLTVAELARFSEVGGRTVVDVTLDEIGRNPTLMVEIATRSGLNVIAGCGHYVHLSHPPTLASETIDEIAARLIEEIENGIADTAVRPGIIGEIGISNPMHPEEEKVLRAAARAHRRTGLPITIHTTPPGRNAHDVLDVLEDERVALGRVAIGHLDTSIDDSLDYHRSIARRGAYVQYDDCGTEIYFPTLPNGGGSFWLPPDRDRAWAVARLIKEGFAAQILLSQDVCNKTYLCRYGGFGYGHILRDFATNLREAGLSEDDLEQTTVRNPRELLVPALAA
jgi:phosphotriesterase-related protein